MQAAHTARRVRQKKTEQGSDNNRYSARIKNYFFLLLVGLGLEGGFLITIHEEIGKLSKAAGFVGREEGYKLSCRC